MNDKKKTVRSSKRGTYPAVKHAMGRFEQTLKSLADEKAKLNSIKNQINDNINPFAPQGIQTGLNENVNTCGEAGVEFPSGAKRSSIKPLYNLIPLQFLKDIANIVSAGNRVDLITPGFIARVARVMTEGADKYGEYNWQKGIEDPSFARDSLNHAIEHLYKAGINDYSEDHLAHAACNIMFVMFCGWIDTGAVELKKL